MKERKSILLSTVSAGMEICWLYAWAVFSMKVFVQSSFSFPGAMGTFLIASVIARLWMGRGWRIIQVAGVQTLCFAACALSALYIARYTSYPVFDTAWLKNLFFNPQTFMDWVNIILILGWTLLFWISGVIFVRRSTAYFTICSRFDIGLGAFFFLFIAKMLLLTRSSVRIDDPVSSGLAIPFLVFGFLGIGFARIGDRIPAGFLPGYRGLGIIASFSAVISLFAAGVVFFLLPFLIQAATIGYRALQIGTGSLAPFVKSIVSFFILGSSVRPEHPGISVPKGHVLAFFGKGRWAVFMERILKWGIKGFVVFLVALVLGFLTICVIRWLISRTARGQSEALLRGKAVPWFIRLWRILITFYRSMVKGARGYSTAADLYQALLRWGRRNGLRPRIGETPLEFGIRLNYCFPFLKPQIDTIISGFNLEAYSEKELSGEAFAKTLSAWRMLRSPRLWPLRVRTRLLSVKDHEYYDTISQVPPRLASSD